MGTSQAIARADPSKCKCVNVCVWWRDANNCVHYNWSLLFSHFLGYLGGPLQYLNVQCVNAFLKLLFSV